jgi:diguanylate cyclase (GGDEF)-like protein
VFAERARQKVASASFPILGSGFQATVSLGLTGYHPVEDIASTIARADQALYRAKHAGRNRVETSPH